MIDPTPDGLVDIHGCVASNSFRNRLFSHDGWLGMEASRLAREMG